MSCIAVSYPAIVLGMPWSGVDIGKPDEVSSTRRGSTYMLGAKAEADEAGGDAPQ